MLRCRSVSGAESAPTASTWIEGSGRERWECLAKRWWRCWWCDGGGGGGGGRGGRGSGSGNGIGRGRGRGTDDERNGGGGGGGGG